MLTFHSSQMKRKMRIKTTAFTLTKNFIFISYSPSIEDLVSLLEQFFPLRPNLIPISYFSENFVRFDTNYYKQYLLRR